MTPRIPCRAVFLDAGGVIVLPDRHLLADAFARIGLRIDPDSVPRAHYRALRAFDRAGASNPVYLRAFCSELGASAERIEEALIALAELADRTSSGVILWSELTPGALETIATLRCAGLSVVIVTNSDGHAEENLADCGVRDVPVIDSVVVGSEKPDVQIFEAALARAGAGIEPADVVHVGDTLAADVAGARAAGITPIHFDPLRTCRALDHRHVRALAGLWRHITPMWMTRD
jgi:putative hydrolase of the HAD superfamily